MEDSTKKKQERMICHLEIGGEHYYFGNLKVLTDNFPKELLGVSYKSLANYFANEDSIHRKQGNEGARVVFKNEKCIIRRDVIITSARTKKEDITTI